ncbi:SDR family NAD(P)-dependent oxidoreductase [Actinokineospora iranica]|uniref:NAD(P)-dependent dehydrogenase, short-chain alcohol dehydrogenase family n=1 Tax=Actinokineospora iranica TaxID=1271860 RepID=A0A1G6WYJ2_9PSEU|nr:SDR family NAD(P)-dependent oxidoreductase [Actinokineospora iranica]SDD70723.1 NAD(P)-dependent dehydrogenase, short-chain alcohol dehydrogenase family [Actinokineospora iranica]
MRTALITGGTGSLGRETAGAIAAAGGWRVVVTGRDQAAVAATADEIGAVGMPLDLGSLAGVRRFAAELAGAGLPPLHAVVCNAGVQVVSGTAVTADGIERTFGVNHLAHFALVRELMPRLAKPARVVFVASDTHDPARPTGMPAPVYTDARSLAYPRDTGESPSLVGRRRYTTSKLCNVLAAYEFARRAEPGIAVNAFDPGLMPGTGLARDYRGVAALAWRYLLPALTVVPGLNAHTPRRSAAALARLVLDQDLTATGRYFSGFREVRSSAESYDRAKAADLWETSVELTAALIA